VLGFHPELADGDPLRFFTRCGTIRRDSFTERISWPFSAQIARQRIIGIGPSYTGATA